MKKLKQLVRDTIDPSRDLGHVDRHQKEDKDKPSDGGSNADQEQAETTIPTDPDAAVATGPPGEKGGIGGKGGGEGCEDCT